MASSGSGHEDSIPSWAAALIASQKEMISQMSAIVATRGTEDENNNKTPVEGERPKKKHKPSLPRDNCDDFDDRFGHLFEEVENEENMEDVDDEDNHEEDNDADPREEMSENGGSEDEDLIPSLNKVPNWKTGSAIKQFIVSTIDNPLPEEIQKQLDEEFIPSEDMKQFFEPPKMPYRLYKLISKMKSKCAIKTEMALYASQTEAFVVAKPLIAALLELKPLGKQVSNARRLITKSLHGLYSISLKISKARRENIRFIFKEHFADTLYSFEPNHVSLFGGTDFESQVEKASKISKLDFSWSKTSRASQSFRSRGSQGFRGSRGSYYSHYSRSSARGRRGASQSYGYKKNPKRGRGASRKQE